MEATIARDGSGTYSLPEAAFVNGTTIDADAVNSDLSDIASALTGSLAKDGQTTATGAQPMGGFNHTGVGAATAATHYARYDQVQNGANQYALTTGTDTILATLTPAVTAYAIGQTFHLKKSGNANTGAVTLNANSVGGGALTWPDGTAMANGDLPANCMFTVTVQATTPVFHLQSVALRPAAASALSGYIASTIADAKGDLIAGTAADTVARLAVGSNGDALMAFSGATSGLRWASASKGRITGLTYANGTDATNDIDVAAGGCMDATGVYWIALSAITKQLDAAWAVGSAAGGLDTGSIGNSDYYIWAIARSDTGVTDALFSLSSTAPTMPTNYDYKRLIGWFKRVSATIVPFTTWETGGGGLALRWTTPTLDVNDANTLTTARQLNAVKVPLNFPVDALVTVSVDDASAAFLARVCSPGETDGAPSATAVPLANINRGAGATSMQAELRIRTDSSGRIAARATLATVDTYAVQTLGFDWARAV